MFVEDGHDAVVGVQIDPRIQLHAGFVDGSFVLPLREALQVALQTAMDRYDWRSVSRPEVLPGIIGADARALGGALLPLHANFAPDRDLFLKAAVIE